MKKNAKLDALLNDAKKAAQKAKEGAIHAVDQDGDGKFNLADIKIIKKGAEDTAKKGVVVVKEVAEEKAQQLEKQILQPIFPKDLESPEFRMPKFIRITERGKKYIDSPVCQGSVGHFSNKTNNFYVVNIFQDSVEEFGLTFFPNLDCEFYYKDPAIEDRYIALDEYFGYLKESRINELEKIAQDLGAKHFKVTYMEEKASFSTKKRSAAAKVSTPADTTAKHDFEEKKYENQRVEAESTFPGHSPIEPTLIYLKNDPSILSLIEKRMDKASPLLHRRYLLHMSKSSGMKINDALKIDTILKGLKCTGNATVASEVKNELRRCLEYEIEF